MTLADAAGAVCAFLNLPAGARTTTIESKTNFLGAVREGEVRRALATAARRQDDDRRRDGPLRRLRPPRRANDADAGRAWGRLTRRYPCFGRGGGSSVGRAPGCGPGGRGFESRPPPLESARTSRLPRRWAGDGLASATKFLVLALSVLYVVAAIGGLSWLDFGTTRDLVLWLSFLLVGAALMLVGQLALPPSGRSALLVSLGAVLGGASALLDAGRARRRRRRDRLQHRARAARRSGRLMLPHTPRLVARGGRRGDARRVPSRATPRPTSSSSAAATSACGRRGTCSSSSPSSTSLLLEAAVCGHGPSGRNGGFCETLWGDAPTLRAQAGDAAALAVCRASEDAVRGIGAWCAENDVDAWFREAPMLRVATTESQVGSWDGHVRAAAELGAPDEVVVGVGRRGARPLRVAALPRRRALPAERDGASGSARARAPREAARARRAHPRADGGDTAPPRGRRRDPHRARPCGRGRPRRQLRGGLRSPATGSRSRSPRATSSSPSPFRTSSTSSAGRAARRSSTAARSSTTRGRPATGASCSAGAAARWGSAAGRRPARARPRTSSRRPSEALRRFFPQTRGRAVTHAWGGPIDVSPTHLPIFGSRGRVHHGFGFTGNGVGPSYLGGEILARLALDRRDERTRLAIVEPRAEALPARALPLRRAARSSGAR